ncbi:hypothetical protein IFR09_13805 [Pseudomonas syringae]|nr:hypothetical protein [Pseudomonas syringae]MBD8789668.1 hypothetical protein [Pseudomonas syringae]MBD8800857.1 hypothetical protein [Pseudomonas syringae]MBD8812238.1 hypothetical protein [Pseudomonas syringae]
MSTDKESGTDKEGVETQDPPVIEGLPYPVPFVAGAGPNNTLYVGQELVLVLSPLISDLYETVSMDFYTDDFVGQVYTVSVPFESGKETSAQATEATPFEAGHKARISAMLKPKADDNIWHKMPDSVEYTFVKPSINSQP